MLKIKALQSNYRKNGNIQFVYTLTGSKEEFAEYEQTKGEYYKESEAGEPLFWSQRAVPVGTELKLSSKGTYYPVSNLADEVERLDDAITQNKGKIKAFMQETGMSARDLAVLAFSR